MSRFACGEWKATVPPGVPRGPGTARQPRALLKARAALTTPQRDAKDKILSICSRPRPGRTVDQLELDAALKQLLRQPTPGGGTATVGPLGQGTWEVISAPHITRLSQALGTEFSPIRYTLDGDTIISNVRYSSSILKEGWLSASGSLVASDPDTLKIEFDRFWVDVGANSLRERLPAGEGASGFSDTAVGWLGKLFFFQQLSYFPVLFVDSDIAVFSFPPLRSNIAVRKIS